MREHNILIIEKVSLNKNQQVFRYLIKTTRAVITSLSRIEEKNIKRLIQRESATETSLYPWKAIYISLIVLV